MAALGYEVEAADLEPADFLPDLPVRQVDLNDRAFAEAFGCTYDLVTAVEVIEHLESPISFLRNISRLIGPGGQALITTPYLDSLAARGKFLLRDRLRMMDSAGDPTHISPIFRELLYRKYLPLAGLEPSSEEFYPEKGHVSGRPAYRPLLYCVGRLRPDLTGDNLILVVRQASKG